MPKAGAAPAATSSSRCSRPDLGTAPCTQQIRSIRAAQSTVAVQAPTVRVRPHVADVPRAYHHRPAWPVRHESAAIRLARIHHIRRPRRLRIRPEPPRRNTRRAFALHFVRCRGVVRERTLGQRHGQLEMAPGQRNTCMLRCCPRPQRTATGFPVRGARIGYRGTASPAGRSASDAPVTSSRSFARVSASVE